MATIDELVIKLSADNADLKASLKSSQDALKKSVDNINKNLDDLSKQSKSSGQIVRDAFATFAGFVGGRVVIGAFNALKGVVGDLWDTLIVGGVEAQRASSDSLNQLSASLARAGVYSARAAKDLDDFSSSVQNSSIYGDDAVKSSAALIESLTRLQSTEALKGATQAAVDLSAALGIDLNSASNLVAKALAGQTSVLSRYGIQVEEGTTQTEKMANVMKALQAFSGAAQAQLNTFNGQTKLLTNTFADFTKIFGKSVVENPAVINAISQLNKFITQAGQIVSQNEGAFKSFVKVLVDQVAVAFETVGKGVLFFLDSLNKIKLGSAVDELDSLTAAQSKVKEQIDSIKSGSLFSAFDASAIEDLNKQFDSLGAQIDAQKKKVDDIGASTINSQQIFQQFGDSLSELRTNITTFDQLDASAKTLESTYKNVAVAAQTMSDAQQQALQQSIDFAKQLADSANTVIEVNALAGESLKTQRELDLITDQEYFTAKEELLAQNIQNEQSMLDEALASGQLSQAQAQQAQLALSLKTNQEQLKLYQERRKREEEVDAQRLANASQFFGNLAQLSRTGNQELGQIAKASAIAQAIIDTYAGANKALGQGGIFGPALAASIVVAGLANVAKIASTPLQTGIDQVPGIGNKDNFPAILAPGERVVPADTNRDLTEFLRGAGDRGNNISVNISLHDVFSTDPREIGLKIVEMINEVSQSNGVRILGATV